MMRRLLGTVPAGVAVGVLVGVLAGVLGLLGGCGGDDPDADGPDPSPTSSSAPTTQSGDPTSAPASTDQPSPTEPTLAPANGPELVEKTSAVRAPEGWQPDPELVGYASSASEPRSRNSMQLVDNVSIAGDDLSLDEMARIAQQSLADDAKVTRLPDVDLSGTPAFHLQYTMPGDPLTYEMISAQRQGRSVGIDFFLDRTGMERRDELVGSVLATFRWL